MVNATTTAVTLTAADATRAIYLDFEGFTNKAPALLGVLVDGTNSGLAP